MALLTDGLLPASFRGVPFAVTASDSAFGRRVALHQYPGRDDPWAEDMGREARRWRFRGFLVTDDVVYAGGPIELQRALLIAAIERGGAGLLTHPTQGVLQASCVRGSVGEAMDAGRFSEIELEFVEAGSQAFPSILTSSTGLLTAANLCTAALAIDGVRLIALAVAAGDDRSDVASAGTAWSTDVVALGSDATALHRLTAALAGPYGRYAGGANVGLVDDRTTTVAVVSIADLTAAASADRVAIDTAAAALAASITDADLAAADGIAAAVTALVDALAAACADPADRVRLLSQLLTAPPAAGDGGAAVAITGMFERAVAAALTTAVADYQPSSADDAANLLTRLADLLDDVATAAADAGDDESYQSVRAARVAVVQDLRARGAALASITTVVLGRALPALVVAQRLYRDPSRAGQLVTGLPGVPSPLFLPTTFQALAA